MSPAAAEFISPPQRQSKQEQFTPQNPNIHFPSTFGSFSINKLSEQNQSVFPNAADGGFACGLASPSGGSAVSSRSKTRLLKRRQLGFQRGKCSTSPPPQKVLGLNSNQVNSATSSNITTGFSASTGDAMYGKFDNKGFVFGASKCGLRSYLNLEKKQSCNCGVGKLNDVGFVFGGNRVIYDSNSNPEYKGYSEDSGISGGNEFQNGTGLNFDQVNNATSSYKFNSFGASIEDFMCGNLNSAASSVMPNFRAEKKQTCSVAVGRSNDEGFVFGADRSKVDLNSNPEHKESSEDGGKLAADDIAKSENVGILFGDHSNISNKSCLMSNLNMGKTQSSGMGQTSKDGCVFGVYESDPDSDCNESSAGMLHTGVNEFWESENAGFLFGKTTSTPLLHLSMENGQCGESKKKSGDKLNFFFGANNSGLITNSGSETRQSGAEEIAVSVKHGKLMQNSEFEEKESSENVETLASAGRGRMNLYFGKVDDLDFGFRGNWSALGTNSNGSKNEYTENGGISVPTDNQKMKSGAQLGKFDKIHFVFGACPEAASSRSDFDKEKSNQGAGNLSFDDCGKMKLGIEVETQKAEAHDVFIFGSGSKKNASFNESTELGDDMNKVYPENAGSNSGFVDTYFDKLDPIVNSISTPLSGSSGNTAGVSGTNTVSKLSDEMRKMTVDDLIKVESSYDSKNRNIDCSASSNPVFVFGNNKKSPGSCTEKSGTTSCDQKTNKSLCGDGNEGAVERTEEDIVGFVSSSDAACSFGEGAQDVMPNENNQHTKSWLGVSDEQIKLVNWKEKQPTNTNNSSSNSPFVGIPTRSPFIFQAGLGISDDGPRDQLNDHPSRLDSEAHPMGRVEKEGNFRFTSTPLGVRTSAKNFRTSNGDPSCAFTVNLSPRLDKKFESSGKSRSHRDKRWKNSRGKLGRAFPESRNNHASKEDNMESPRSYSPMDFSPYQDNNCAPSTSHVTRSPHGKKEDLEAVSEGAANITEGDKKCGELDGEDFYCQNERVVNSSLEETQTECSNSNMKREESECKKQNQFCFSSREKDVGEIKFTFSASACTQDKFSATKRRTKKYRMKVVPAPNCTTASQKVDTASSSVQFPVEPHDIEGHLNIRDSEHEGNNEHDKRGSTAPTQKACQKWRIRGNQAYENGYLSKAEGFYTKGINSVPRSEASGSCIEPLVLCYSNRAAARMSLGRMREALGDCMQAAALDPNFHKVQIRAANCHLAMGEVEVALQYFSKCLETGADICLDRRIVIEAANGLQKAQKVAKCVNQCAELIRQRTCNAAISALEVISGVLSISSYSEKLLEMKGEALLMLRRYEEVIQLCEQTLVFAEKNVATVVGDNNLHIVDGSTYNNSSMRLWRWHLMAKSYFHLGKLEAALDLIEKQELLRSSEGRCGSSIQESSISFAVTVRELLHHKNAGNEAFQSGRHIEAVEHYTAAVSSSIESRPFAAICFCNRAAAHQALGQISDAIADCSLAIALDQSYSKAVSRRATLHEKIRDYEQAASDLQLLISLLEKQLQEELTKVRRRLFSMEEKAKKGMSLDHYLILGIKQSDTASEIKKAYRKAALRHHPDKAGQFLAKSESGDDGNLWKEIADEVYKDADRLFKMIGEAYAILSDPTKRSDYDLQEELRNEQKERNRSRGSRGSPEFYSSPSRATANGQYGQGYRYSYYRQW